MHNYKIYSETNLPTTSEQQKIVQFLFSHLDQYGDTKEDINACFDFAIKKSPNALGGFVLTMYLEDELIGATIINQTGMSGYIPENLLVYIAVHANTRGRGIGKLIMTKAIEFATGDIALHVEPDNPAKHLYEKLGFENKYLEMRLKKVR